MKFLKRLFKKKSKWLELNLSYPHFLKVETEIFYKEITSDKPSSYKWDAMELFMNQVSRRVTDEEHRRVIYGKVMAAYTLATDPKTALVGCINDIGYTILEGLEREVQPG